MSNLVSLTALLMLGVGLVSAGLLLLVGPASLPGFLVLPAELAPFSFVVAVVSKTFIAPVSGDLLSNSGWVK